MLGSNKKGVISISMSGFDNQFVLITSGSSGIGAVCSVTWMGKDVSGVGN
jgi:hypothetical protein